MVVVKLESLPLGFRFHPTDEELINHYLKGKIKGRKSQLEIIPEIDVCKCEPWDLPDKSVIKTLDPEWFFFAPRDRKYPTGNRSNRATGAGYWKATGKDRNIKSRTSSGPTVIGMKKTLVFYCGRAPKGDRTGWIMHEYRTVDGDVDGKASDQGDYVLCRLFKKPLEKSMSSNYDELDEDGSSLTPLKSSPENTKHETKVGEEFEISRYQHVMSTDMQQNQPLPDDLQQHNGQVDNKKVYSRPEDRNSNCNNNPRRDSDVVSEIEDNISLDDIICLDDLKNPFPLSPLATSEVEQMDFSSVDFGFLIDQKTNNGPMIESSKNDSAEDATLNAFLESTLLDPDEEFNEQQHCFPTIQSNQLHQMDDLHDALMPKLSRDEISETTQMRTQKHNVDSDFNSQLYLSMDSWESVYKFSQTVEDGTVTDKSGNTFVSSSVPLQEVLNDNISDLFSKEHEFDVGSSSFNTGIQIRPRALKQSIPRTSSQGNAPRRIRLQRKLQVNCNFLSQTRFDDYACDLKVEEDNQQKISQAEDAYQKADPAMPREFRSEKALNFLDVAAVSSSASTLTSQAAEPTDKICMEEKSASVMDNTNQSRSVVRRRKVFRGDAESIQYGSSADNPRGTKCCSASVYLVSGGLLLIFLVMLFGTWMHL